MADLSDLQAALTTKLVGSDSTGVETNPATVGSNGALQVMPPVTSTGIANGEVATAAISTFLVRKTAYTEQSTNAQRSIASSSANDTSAGTGARTVIITYYDQTGAGPSTETITLNGVSNVNTVSSTICFIESIVVATVGSGLANAGTLTLKAAAAGGGATIATVAIGDNKTKWAAHYVAVNKTCYVSDIHAAANVNAATAGAIAYLTWKKVNFSNAFETQLTAKQHYIGNIGSMQGNYAVPVAVVGPALIQAYVTTEATTANTHWVDFTYFEI